MHSNDDDSLTLSKWPFYIGDILLVATALAIAILEGWRLSGWQVASCVMAVAFGAALFVLPFVIEFYMRSREVADDRSAETRQLQRHLEHAAGLLNACGLRLDALESASCSTASGYQLLIAGVDQKLASIEVFKSEQAAAVDGLKKQLKAMDAQLAKPPQGDAVLDALKASVDELQARLAEIAEPDESIELRLKALETAPPVVKVCSEPATESPPRPPRQRRKAGSELLRRAIKEEANSTNSAVSRIIYSKKLEKAMPQSAEVIVEEPVPIEKNSGAVAVENRVAREPDSVTETPVQKMESVAAPSERRVRRKANETILTVSILIGIGNKPFLRGSAGGLNWDTGVPMDFEEIGKWRWIAPADLEEPLELQVYLNDEDADRKGRHLLGLGQKIELTPAF